MTTKEISNEKGNFKITKKDTVQRFVCEKCLKPKVSKTEVTWVDPEGKTKKICNGCCGEILKK